jgi:inosine-uridine nucleoside N-ribohydrolase
LCFPGNLCFIDKPFGKSLLLAMRLPFRHLVPLAILALAILVPSATQARTPVVLVTDIGTDIDDTWAIALALRSPELDLKLVVVDPADTAYRAKVAAKFLEASGHSEVEIAIGDNSPVNGDSEQTLLPWIEHYDIGKYPGKVDPDGVSALAEFIQKSTEPVTIIGIGPVHTLALVLKRDPNLAAKCRFIGVGGSFDVGYNGGRPAAETNVRVNPEGLRTVLAAPWKDILLTPLDTCDFVTLTGERYHAIWSATSDPMLRALIESYCIFATRQTWMICDYFTTRSTILYDCVAVYLAYSEELVEIETVSFDVTSDGYTRRSPQGPFKARVALRWKNRDGFEAQLAGRLLAR